jgi:hypothetical protein
MRCDVRYSNDLEAILTFVKERSIRVNDVKEVEAVVAGGGRPRVNYNEDDADDVYMSRLSAERDEKGGEGGGGGDDSEEDDEGTRTRATPYDAMRCDAMDGTRRVSPVKKELH